jgi:hypothetical protein
MALPLCQINFFTAAAGAAGKLPLAPSRSALTGAVEVLEQETSADVARLSNMVFRPWSPEGDGIEARTMQDSVPSMDIGLAWKCNPKLNLCGQAFRDIRRDTHHISGEPSH